MKVSPHVMAMIVSLVLTACTMSANVHADDDVDFARDVQPILAAHCLDCHSDSDGEAGLSLADEASALKGGDSGEPTIVPGSLEASYLITRVSSNDPKKQMPPDGERLSAEELSILKSWISNQAHWNSVGQDLPRQPLEHWSFIAPAMPAVPPNGLAPVDAFISEKLQEAGLSQSASADRARLIRRLYLVMHGLPPTPEQVQRFVNDSRPDAWESLVDEVLSSPRYGERWATFWLDLVHFGETHGFETNQERPNAWHYRDWVINAFNEDKPYDRFVMEQIAGDALGEHLGTGFLVAGPYDLVKGQDPLLGLIQRQDELADILNTTGTAFLGLTIGCARCHNHKFDPITQTDYYSLQAVFAGVNHAERAVAPTEVSGDELAQIDQEIGQLASQLAPYKRTDLIAQVRTSEDQKLIPTRPAVTATLNEDQLRPIAAKHIRFTIQSTNASEPCLDELEVYAGEENVALASAGAVATSGGDFIHELHKLKHINDGLFGNARSWIASQVSGGWVQITLPEPRIVDRIVWARDREGRYADRVATQYVIEVASDDNQWQTVATSEDRLPFGTPAEELEPFDFSKVAAPEDVKLRQLAGRLSELRRQRIKLSEPMTAYIGTFSQPGTIHRLYRGEPTAPREAVQPAAIASLSDIRLSESSNEQQRRLAIAQWIASPENPLTARVMVNRIWQHLFGIGLVDTASDFGANGTRPTHPELLDWLAIELIQSGWSIKHVERLILCSATWKQDSAPRTEGLGVDASSRLLWRYPPRRLEAEAIRDSMLAVSGKLDLTVGGPGFSSFKVERETVRHYFPKTEFGPEDWRRMIYMTRVRQERDATFGVFDCPDFNQVVPQRSRSTTPLQALNLLNSPFVLDQATHFADRLQNEVDDDHERVKLAYSLCFSRAPSAPEIEAALRFIAETDWQQFARVMFNANEFVFIP